MSNPNTNTGEREPTSDSNGFVLIMKPVHVCSTPFEPDEAEGAVERMVDRRRCRSVGVRGSESVPDTPVHDYDHDTPKPAR